MSLNDQVLHLKEEQEEILDTENNDFVERIVDIFPLCIFKIRSAMALYGVYCGHKTY